MAKAPGDRFDSAAEFASALERPGVVGPARARARPMTIALAVIALVAAIASGSLLLRRRDAAVRAPGGTVASGFDRKLTQLTTGAGVEEWPAWSPDGTRLAYVAEVDGFRQLFVRTLASGEERRVTHGPRDDIQPAWSPDGDRLVFVRATADSGKLAAGRPQRLVLRGRRRMERGPGVGPGGAARLQRLRAGLVARRRAGSLSTRHGRVPGGSGSAMARGGTRGSSPPIRARP